MCSPDNMPTHCDLFLEQCVNHERMWGQGISLGSRVCVRVYVHVCVCVCVCVCLERVSGAHDFEDA